MAASRERSSSDCLRSVMSLCVPQARARRPSSTMPVRLFRKYLALPSRSTSCDSLSISWYPERTKAWRYSTFPGRELGKKSPRRAPTISSARS